MIHLKQLVFPGCVAMLLAAHLHAITNAPRLKSRCSEDSLENGPATERTEWSAKCGHITSNERQYSLFDGSSPRSRVQYPLYGKDDLSEIWIAPTDRNAPCNVPSGIEVVAFCTASCYTGEQEVLFPDGFFEIRDAKEQILPEVMALRDASTFENLKLVSYPVESYTEEIRPVLHRILRFKMKSGGSLRVTPNHPIVDQDGVVKTADKFRSGQSLIHYINGTDPIVSIRKEWHFGKVYNLAPDTRLPISNILVAQGYLNGSSYFQNDGINFQNRRFLRRALPDTILE